MSRTREIAGQFNLEDWPIEDVLTRVANAVDHLLQDHNCDMHGYEGISYAAVAARMHVERGTLRQRESEVRAEERGSCTWITDLDPEFESVGDAMRQHVPV